MFALWHLCSLSVNHDGTPGNGTPRDAFNITVTLVGYDVEILNATAVNVPPLFVDRPQLTFTTNSDGSRLASITNVNYVDPGIRDVITQSVIWGDGDETFANGDGRLQRTYAAPPDLSAAAVYPVTVQLTDDNTGRGKYRFESMVVGWNNDDDDGNEVSDHLDAGPGPLEDDLVMLDLSNILRGYETNDDGTVYSQYSYDDTAAYYEQTTPIRIWLQRDKGGTPWQSVDSWHGWALPAGVTTVWIKGTKIGTDTVYVSWLPRAESDSQIQLGQVSIAVDGHDAIPEVISIDYRTESGSQIVAIQEGSFLPISGTVKHRRDVPSVEVKVWADLNFDGIRDATEVAIVQAFRTDQATASGDRLYKFETWFYVFDDGPSPGNGTPVDPLQIVAKPSGGIDYNSFIIVLNVDPTWIDYPILSKSYNEFGVIENATVSGSFHNAGILDAHTVSIYVNGVKERHQEIPVGLLDFTIDVGPLTPADGEKITIKLLDDDGGKAMFYITLASVVSKSFIADVYATGGAGSVSVAAANPVETTEAAEDAASAANLRLAAFAAATRLQFAEDPTAASTRGDSRLHSRHDYVVGYDGAKVRYFQRIHEYLQAGFELYVLPAAICEDSVLRYEAITEEKSGKAGVFIIGSPNWVLEPGINVPLRRTSTDIWYELNFKFDMVGNYARLSLENTDASSFPSNRIWINETLKNDYQQKTTVKLWQSSPTHGLNMVVGRREQGNFERQTDLLTGAYWIPLEN